VSPASRADEIVTLAVEAHSAIILVLNPATASLT